MQHSPALPAWAKRALLDGQVIPAHPLALTPSRRLDERRQRALTRYYHAAGAGGIAVGVHTTQFAIRQPRYGLFEPVLELASETISGCDESTGRRTLRVAGLCGLTKQAVAEACLAREFGYHAGLLSLGVFQGASDDDLLHHCQMVGNELPLIGFYLQPAAGGRLLSPQFWRRFAEIPQVVAVKVAPFNRYQTLDVIRAVAQSGRAGEIALYTGNDDNIVADLLTRFEVPTPERQVNLRIVGGLLGHWACWTRSAVRILHECKQTRRSGQVPSRLLTLGAQITDCNAAFFDAANGFAGCIPGIHDVLRRQGLLRGIWCLDEDERLSPGQAREIDRVYTAYPHLNDDDFVRRHLDEWLR